MIIKGSAQRHTRDPHELGKFAFTQATKLKVLIDSIRVVEAYPRGDYKDLLDLMEAYIGLNEGRFQFLGCGAVHKARWMGKQLYCYKMAILQEYILQGIASKSQLQKISGFVDFCTFVLNSWWFNCPLAASAPHHDLELISNQIYSCTNSTTIIYKSNSTAIQKCVHRKAKLI